MYKQHVVLVVFFIVIGFFSIYFYIQNLKFLVFKKSNNYFIIKKNKIYLNFFLIEVSIIFNFLNFFGIFLLDDIFLFLTNLVLYI